MKASIQLFKNCGLMPLRMVLLCFALTTPIAAFGQNRSEIDSLENVLKTLGEDSSRVNCLIDLSWLYQVNEENEKSLQSAHSALELAERLNYKKGIASSFQYLGYIYERQGHYQEALKSHFADIQIRKEIGDNYGIGRTYNDIGNIYEKLGNYVEAVKYCSESLKICKEIGGPSLIAHMYTHVGVMYAKQGNYSKALDHFFDALSIRKENDLKWGIATSYNNIGIVNAQQGNYPEALEYYIASLKIREELGDKDGLGSSYSNIGDIYKKQENNQEALQHYLAALKFKKEAGGKDKENIANIYHNIANIYQAQGNHTEAMEHLLTAMKVYDEIDNIRGTAYVYNSIGNVYESKDDDAEALENYFSSFIICKEIQDKECSVYACLNIGRIYQKQGNVQEARKYLNDCLSLSKEIGTKEKTASAYLLLSKLDSAEFKFAQALENYKLHTLYKDSVFNEESDQHLNQIRIQYETEKKDREIELLNKDNEIKALQIQEKETSLLASRLEAEKRQNELLLLSSNMEIQQLKLDEIRNALECEQIETRINLELMGKEKILTEEKLEKQKLLRNGMFGGIFLFGLIGLLLFRSFRLRKKLEKQRAIIQERHRISADLHDDVGAGLSKITLLSEFLKTQAKTTQNRKEAEKISETALELSSTLSEIIWALNSKNDYLDNMIAYIRRYSAEYFEDSQVKLRIFTPTKLQSRPVNGEHRRNIFYAVKEALHNIMKHSQATEAELHFILKNDELDVIISDNGKGIQDLMTNKFGNGIKNMQTRMKNIGGKFKIKNEHGTSITLQLAI